MTIIEDKLANLELAERAQTTVHMTTTATNDDVREIVRSEIAQARAHLTDAANAAATATATAVARDVASRSQSRGTAANATPTTSPDDPLIVVLGGFPQESARDHIERSGRAYLRLLADHQRPGAGPMTDQQLQEHFAYDELFSPWILSFVAHICFQRRHERAARRLIELARAYPGPVRMGAVPLTLWMSALKSRSERDRDHRLLRMAEEAQRHMHVDHADSTTPPWRLVCWQSATVVVGRKRIATVRREDGGYAYCSATSTRSCCLRPVRPPPDDECAKKRDRPTMLSPGRQIDARPYPTRSATSPA